MTLLPFASGALGEFASGVGVTEGMGGIEILPKDPSMFVHLHNLKIAH